MCENTKNAFDNFTNNLAFCLSTLEIGYKSLFRQIFSMLKVDFEYQTMAEVVRIMDKNALKIPKLNRK